ncbi:MAG: flagellar protein FlaG [Rhodocyclaceae bacterium]
MGISSVAPPTPPVAMPQPSAQQNSNRQAPPVGEAGPLRVSASQNADAAPRSTERVAPVEQPELEDLRRAMDEVQTAIGAFTRDLQFSIDEDTGRTIVKIVDRETDEVIKQIPSEEMVRISKALDRLQGLLVRQEA